MNLATTRVLASSPRAQRFLRFGAVGLTGIAINELALWLFTDFSALHYATSAVLATQVSSSWNFALADRWVFWAERPGRVRRYLLFMALSNAWLLLRVPLLVVFTDGLGMHYLIANLVSIAIATLGRFAVSDVWIWREATRQAARHHYYDVHGLVRIASDGKLPELAPFAVPSLDGESPDIVLELRARGFGGLRLRPQVETGYGHARYVEQLGALGFAVDIQMGDLPVKIQASPVLRWSPHVLYTNIVEPVLRWVIVRKGHVLAHAACLRIGDQGVLITAETDTGKTTTCLRAMREYGAKFISDDMTILASDGAVLGYPKPLTVSAHTLAAASAAPLPRTRRAYLQVQSRLHSKTGRRVGMALATGFLPVASMSAFVQWLIPPPKYFIRDLVPDAVLVSAQRARHLVLIERGDHDLQESLTHEQASEILAANTEDAYGFPPYPSIAPGLTNGDKPIEAAIRSEALLNIACTRLRTKDRNWFETLPTIVATLQPDPDEVVVVNDQDGFPSALPKRARRRGMTTEPDATTLARAGAGDRV